MGYAIKHLQSSTELDAYDSIYDFTSVDRQHLEEQLTSEEYNHFVIANPEGKFVAYCETSIYWTEWHRSGQHIGWIDYIGTRPDDQRKGLGLTLLLHGLQKLQEQGASKAKLVTISSNLPAINLYKKAGFHHEEIEEAPSYQITLQPK
jgi:ribosomal protein S18 acetylase RimI-like enzyme